MKVLAANGGVVVPGKKYTSDCSQYGIGFKLDTDGWVDGWLCSEGIDESNVRCRVSAVATGCQARRERERVRRSRNIRSIRHFKTIYFVHS